jgi:hypothetical protein
MKNFKKTFFRILFKFTAKLSKKNRGFPYTLENEIAK